MKRRTALRLTAALPLAAAGAACATPAAATAPAATSEDTFRHNFAPHEGMFHHHAGEDILDQIRFAHERGFRAWEDNGMRARSPALQTKIGNLLAKNDMTMGVFVANDIDWQKPTLTLGPGEHQDAYLAALRDSVEVAKRCNAKWVTVVPGVLDHRQEPMLQFANLVDTLRRGAEILEPHGLVAVLEPLNFRDHPSLFLTKATQAYAICRAVDSPSCKILFDVYHQQIQEGNLIPNIEAVWDEIAYFQLGDNPGRKEPTTGEINYGNVLRFTADKGFDGVYGMEHGNSQAGKAGELAIIAAYRRVDLG